MQPLVAEVPGVVDRVLPEIAVSFWQGGKADVSRESIRAPAEKRAFPGAACGKNRGFKTGSIQMGRGAIDPGAGKAQGVKRVLSSYNRRAYRQ